MKLVTGVGGSLITVIFLHTMGNRNIMEVKFGMQLEYIAQKYRACINIQTFPGEGSTLALVESTAVIHNWGNYCFPRGHLVIFRDTWGDSNEVDTGI